MSAAIVTALADCVAREKKAAQRAKVAKVLDGFDWNAYHKNLTEVLGDAVGLIVTTQGDRAARQAGGEFNPDDPFVKKHMTGYVGDRIVDLDATTKDDVITVVVNAMDAADGTTTSELGDLIAAAVQDKFEAYADWRADRIARTEASIVYNYGTAFGYQQSGVSEVVISDGDDDEECRKIDGTTQTLAWFLANPIAHPNCERDASPVLPE